MALLDTGEKNTVVPKDAGEVDMVTSTRICTKDQPSGDQTKQKALGVALIRPEFVVQNHQRKLTEKYLPPAAILEIKQIASANNTAKRENDDRGTAGEVPQKKTKLRGRYKKRPHDTFPKDKEKLCPAIVTATECRFGEKCKFSHDVAEYVRLRPAAHSDSCYLFDTFGKCTYGVACLCAGVHTGEDYTQLVNEELWSKSSQKVFITNRLPNSTLMSLCKRKYDFAVSNKLMAAVSNGQPVERVTLERPLHYRQKQQEVTGCSLKPTQASGQAEIRSPDNNIPSYAETKPAAEQNDAVLNCEQKEIKIQNVNEDLEQQVNKESDDLRTHDNKNMVLCLQKSTEDSEISSFGIGEGGAVANFNHVACDPPIKSSVGVSMVTGDGTNILDKEEVVLSKSQPVQERLESVETEEGIIKIRPQEVKKVDFRDKLYLAPLTTVGNLPFRRICKHLGADITCSEMATATGLLQGHKSEWALLKRHHTEDVFGAQVCGSNVEAMTRCAQVLMENTDVDFIDINCGCPIDLFFKKGEGCALMAKSTRLQNVVRGMTAQMDVPLTVKMRTGIFESKSIADKVIPTLRDLDVAMVTLHGRSREQRYTRSADWDYIKTCAELAAPMPLFGNGDILSYDEYNLRKQTTGVAGCLIARGALIKPWIFTEIKEQRHWDISSGERLELLRDFCHYGLEHWGSDQKGVQTTRRFLLEWLSFLYRYIPVGVLETVPQKINQKPPYYVGRNDLETVMASPNCADWIKISEMLLGPVPDSFQFLPKHKANSYQ